MKYSKGTFQEFPGTIPIDTMCRWMKHKKYLVPGESHHKFCSLIKFPKGIQGVATVSGVFSGVGRGGGGGACARKFSPEESPSVLD